MEFVRGSENDMWDTAPVDDAPGWARAINRARYGNPNSRSRCFDGRGTQYYANARNWLIEEEFPAAQVMSRAADWLEANQEHERFMLWVESFDPHEPFHVPEPYRSMYSGGIDSPDFNPWPPYQDRRRKRKRFRAQRLRRRTGLDSRAIRGQRDHGRRLAGAAVEPHG